MADKLAATNRLQKLTLESLNNIVATLSHVVRTDELLVVSRAIVLFALEKKCFDLAKYCIKTRIKASETMEELLAQNTLERHIVQDIFMYLGKNHVKDLFAPAIKKVLALKKNLCPDPRTSVMGEETKTKLGEVVRELINGIMGAVNSMPTELRKFLTFSFEQIKKKWGKDELPHILLIMFIFGHMVVPPTLNPTIWGISKENHTSDSSRTAIVLTKILRKVANGTSFEDTSPLASFNITIKKYKPKLKQYVDDIMNISGEGNRESMSASSDATVASSVKEASNSALGAFEMPSNESMESAFQVLHHCLYIWKDAISEFRNGQTKIDPAESRIFFELMGMLEEIELVEGKPEIISDFTIIGLEKATKPPTKATMRRPVPQNVSAPGPSSLPRDGATKPYVRQLSEKWNREHQMQILEQKKRADASAELLYRKKQRETEREEKLRAAQGGSSPSNVPAIHLSSPTKSVKTMSKMEEDTLTSGSESMSPRYRGLKRSQTTIPGGVDNHATTTTTSSSTTVGTTSTAPFARSATTLSAMKVPEESETVVATDTTPKLKKKKSGSKTVDGVAVDLKESLEAASAGKESRKTIVVNSSAKRKRKTSTNPGTPSPTTGNDELADQLNPTTMEDVNGRDSPPSDSPTSKRFGSKAAARRTLHLTESEISAHHSVLSNAGRSVPNASTLGDDGNESSSEDNGPKSTLTIMSLAPNPTLTTSENTPVTPRTAEFLLRERSSTVSSPKQTKKDQKAMGILGMASTPGSEDKSSTNMAQIVRELGVSNAKLLKDLELVQQQKDQLEKDLIRLRGYHESKSAKVSEFHQKLTSSVLYRRDKDTHIRRLTLHCKRTMLPSLDDNLWDYQRATMEDRRTVLASVVYSRSAGNPSLSASPSLRSIPNHGHSNQNNKEKVVSPRGNGIRSTAPATNSDGHLVRAESIDVIAKRILESDDNEPASNLKVKRLKKKDSVLGEE